MLLEILGMMNTLKNYHILVVDEDVELSRVLKSMLREMGFIDVQTTRSGKEAITMLRGSPFDFLITEWNTQHLDGMGLLKFLRHSPDSPNAMLPVIMITGRAEQADVFLARDYGINEYIIKPFTARSIYNRLERIIEQPRNFVLSETFIGPCRRTKSKPPEGVAERRERPKITPQLQPKNIKAVVKNIGSEPKIFLPDFSLKFKLGKDLKLSDFVTPETLQRAQSAIDAITQDSLQWIRDNLMEIKLLYDTMVGSEPPMTISTDISGVALIINARAGTFGYSRAAEVAYGLYLFARNKLDPKNKGHHIVVQKHIEILHVILGNQMRGNAGAVGAQIASELKSLIAKYSLMEA